jgi:DNA-binding NtrC family response regulator
VLLNPAPNLADICADEDTPTRIRQRSSFPKSGPVTAVPRDHAAAALIDALNACGGNQTRAAEMLGVSRRTLVNRLNQLDLPRPRKGR